MSARPASGRVRPRIKTLQPHHLTDKQARSVGLPVGVHFAGRYGEEATLLALAAQLEATQRWSDRVPAL